MRHSAFDFKRLMGKSKRETPEEAMQKWTERKARRTQSLATIKRIRRVSESAVLRVPCPLPPWRGLQVGSENGVALRFPPYSKS